MIALAAALAAAAVLVLLAPGDRSRLGRALPGAAPSGLAAQARVAVDPAIAVCALTGTALALVVAAPVGLVLGLVLAVAGPRVLRRLEPRSVRLERERLHADLPLALDLLAAVLAGGAPPATAAGAVAAAVSGPVGARLASVAAALDVGSPPGEAWSLLAGAEVDDPLGPAARALARAADGGAPVAQAVSRLAGDARADAAARGEEAARRVGVLAVAPLGLCFLPAFVLLGVVPVVVGLAAPLLASF